MVTQKILARDMLPSLATKLPANLLLDAVSDYGKFTVLFLLQLTEEQQESLRNKAKKCEKKVLLEFYSISKNEIGFKNPQIIEDINAFDYSKVTGILFRNCMPPKSPEEEVLPLPVTLVLRE